MADLTPDQSTDDLESKRRLALALSVAAQQAMQGGSASTPSDASAPDATPEGDGSSSSDLVKALSAPAPAPQPNQRVLDLRKQADAIPATGVDEPSNWKQALFNAATKILPVALTARFAGTAAGAGAGEGEVNATRQFALDQQNRRTQLLQEAQQAEQEDEKQREFSLEDQTRRAQIADAAARAQQAELDRQSDLQERGREFNLNRQDRLNTATTAADRSKQEDARTLAIAGLTRDASGNIVPLPKSGLALTKQSELDKPSGGEGTYTLAEDGQGNPVLFNSKTGQTKPAPNGLQKSGTFSKNQAAQTKANEPITTAQSYANDYLSNGVFTGPGDEALQEKFFELAKPSTGFRMTQPQIDMLRDSRSWMNSAEAQALHAKTGQWFTAQQRKQIVDTMNQLAKAKLGASQSGRGNTFSTTPPPGAKVRDYTQLGN